MAAKRGRGAGLKFDRLVFPKSANGEKITSHLALLRRAGSGQAMKKLTGYALAGFILEQGLEVDEMDCLDGLLAERIRAARRARAESSRRSSGGSDRSAARSDHIENTGELPALGNSSLVERPENAYSKGNQSTNRPAVVDTNAANHVGGAQHDVTDDNGAKADKVSVKQSEGSVKPTGPTLRSMFMVSG